MANEKQALVRKAQRRALAHLNAVRVKDGYAPFKRLSPTWWRWYGQEWIDLVKAEEEVKSTSPFAQAFDSTRAAEEAMRNLNKGEEK